MVHRRRSGPRRLGIVAAATVMALGIGSTGSVATVRTDIPAADRPAGRQLLGRDQVVTLITGDRVMLRDGKLVRVVPGTGRRGIGFSTFRTGGKLQVVPSDVEPLLASGRIDRRLFDVNGLVEAGLDDSRSPWLPLIVTYAGPAGRASVRAGGAEAVRELPSINGAAIRIAKERGFSFMSGKRLAAGVERVWLDGTRRVSLDESVPRIGGPAAWQADLTGKGVTVAVLDTGIDNTHPDLTDRVMEAKNFTEDPAGDQIGHGTHVASTIAGTGERYRGVAPEAKILDGKVCETRGCPESAILAAMQWAAVEKRADVINLSLGGPDFPEVDPLEEAVNTLTAQTGALFVIAAGNSGRGGARTIDSPGSADAALTVGAVDKSDDIADFASRGPRVGDGAVKPDITAPGVAIVAAEANTGGHVRASGTSMATPHVVGAAAVLAQQHPDWGASRLKAALMASAKVHPSLGAFDQGAGRVDVARAIRQTLVTEPGSVSFGTAAWPHDDDTPVAERVTYRNLGPSDVTLNLHAGMTDSKGAPAPAGALTVSASSVTVPAGGTASVTVTSNTRHNGPDGIYSGRITATGSGDVSVTTPLGVDKEVESYNVTVTHLDPDGRPTATGDTLLIGLDNPAGVYVFDDDGTATVRLPRGRFHVLGSVFVERSPGSFESHQLVQPVLLLDRDTVLSVDARLTRPITTTVPRSDAGLALLTVGWTLDTAGRDIDVGLHSFWFPNLHTAPLGAAASAPDKFTAWVMSHWGVPGPDGEFVNSPYTYHLLNTRNGSFWHGFDRVVKDRDLALLRSSQNVQADHSGEGKRRVWKAFWGYAPGVGLDTATVLFPYDPQLTGTHYLETGATAWSGDFDDGIEIDGFPSDTTSLWSRVRGYRAGHRYAERWNSAVFGPSLAVEAFPGWKWARRTGDEIFVNVPMYSDQDDHAGISETTDTPSTKLYRDGVLIGETPAPGTVWVTNVPGEKGEFKLVTSSNRPTVSNFSTRTDAEWTFSSQTASDQGEVLPLWAVRYFPAVDNRNAVKRNPATILPMRLETESGARVGSLTRVEIQVSGDDGTTWTKAAVRRTGKDRYVAVFATPPGSYVSLKATAADSNGSTTEQRIIRAYAQR